jgi:glycosyltransferase involved in cell wall biosynthesis
MRVLMLADSLGNGGAERQLALTAEGLLGHHQVRVWTMRDGVFAERLRARGVPVVVRPRRSDRPVSTVLRLWRDLLAWRPDVVHSWGWISTLAAGPICRLLDIPLVDGTIRTATPPSTQVTLKRLGRALSTLEVSNTSAGLTAWRVPVTKGRVVHNGFDESRLATVALRAEDGDPFRVIMVGRMEPEKDYPTLLAAARILAGEEDSWRFELVGGGADEPRLRADGADLVARGIVEFSGGGLEVLDRVAGAQIGVLLTNPAVAREGCSNAIMEYMAVGLPVVCGDGGGNRELVMDGVTGVVVPQEEPEALAECLRDLRADTERRRELGEAGRTRIMEEFSTPGMVAGFERIYEEARSSTRSVRRTATEHHAEEMASTCPMRVLFLTAHSDLAGPLPKLAPLMVGEMRRLGCEVATEPWSHRQADESLWDKLLERSMDVLRVRRRLRAQKFDVMLVATTHNWPALLRDIPLLALTRGRCRARVLHFHGSNVDMLLGSGRWLLKAFSRWLVRQCDAILVLSREEQSQWTAFSSQTRFEVVINPFVPPDHTPSASGRGPDDPPVILFVGRLVPDKGVFDLLDALRLVARDRRCTLRIVGEGSHRQELSQRVDDLELGDVVTLMGYVEGDPLAELYASSDVFVLPSYREGFPTVITEAMSYGLPVVTTSIRGAMDQLVEGENALFVPPRHPADLADALKRLLDDPALRARMGEQNREKVKEYAPDLVVPRYVDIMRSVVEGELARR